jgi:superfamily II DNA helicase RecQ
MANYRDARNFGKFTALPLSEIESLVEQLLEAGYLKQVGSKYPTLKLALKGEAALKERLAIEVDLRPARTGATQRRQAEISAGGTIALSGQMLARGLTPEQIAAERGLTLGTIYSHFARLIADGRVDVNAVLPAKVQKQIRSAIAAAGSTQFLGPIKARLPDDVSYDMLRCVVNAWQRENLSSPASALRSNEGTSSAEPDPQLFERLRAWRLDRAKADKVPPYIIFSDDALRGIAAAQPKSSADLLAVRGVGPVKVERYGAEVLALVTRTFRVRPTTID